MYGLYMDMLKPTLTKNYVNQNLRNNTFCQGPILCHYPTLIGYICAPLCATQLPKVGPFDTSSSTSDHSLPLHNNAFHLAPVVPTSRLVPRLGTIAVLPSTEHQW